MNAKLKSVQLSARELMYLKNVHFLPQPLVQIIEAAQSIGGDRHAVAVSDVVAEQFRSAFTDHLAKVGFGSDYEPTSEGKMLEDLIDHF